MSDERTNGASTHGVLGFDPTSPEFRLDPYPAYRRLRERAAVLRGPDANWLVTRYHECAAILQDVRWEHVENFRCLPADTGGPTASAERAADRRVRGPVGAVLTARLLRRFQARIQQVVDELLDAAIPRGEVDLVEAFAYPLAAIVFCELLGVPPGDREVFKRWVNAIIRGVDAVFAISPEESAERDRASREFGDYFRRLIAQRRAGPLDDLLGRLLVHEEDGEPLSEDELIALCILVLIAGHESTANLVASGTLTLLRHPDQLARLRSDPALAPSAVEELLRFDPPGQFAIRRAGDDMELGGHAVRRGEHAILFLGAANRDPAVFPDPDRLDLGRSDNRHLTFGHGPHFCLGASLARLEARAAFTSLLRRAPDVALAGVPRYKPTVDVRGLSSLPVALRGSGA